MIASPGAARGSLRDGKRATGTDGTPPWRWPLNVTAYDRSPDLSPQEARALAVIGDDIREWPRRRCHPSAWRSLDRWSGPWPTAGPS
jgi:hypothetical protein